MRLSQTFMAGLLALGFATQASAHHAFAAEFDVERPVALSGTVTQVEMINPHSWIHIEVEGEDGESTVWMVEGGSPNSLLRRGITKSSVPVGSELTVNGYQARDGTYRAVARDITFVDGRALFFGGTRVPGGDE